MQAVEPVSNVAKRHWLWPAGILGLLCLHALAMGVVVFIATRDPSFAVEPQAYRKAVAWDRTLAARQASQQLGWQATIRTSSSLDTPGQSRVSCRITDARGLAVMAASVRIEAFSHARAAERFQLTMEPDRDGNYVGQVPMNRRGTWEFRISAQRGVEQFDTVLVQTIEDPT